MEEVGGRGEGGAVRRGICLPRARLCRWRVGVGVEEPQWLLTWFVIAGSRLLERRRR